MNDPITPANLYSAVAAVPAREWPCMRRLQPTTTFKGSVTSIAGVVIAVNDDDFEEVREIPLSKWLKCQLDPSDIVERGTKPGTYRLRDFRNLQCQ